MRCACLSSLRFKVLAILVVGAVLPVIALGLYNYEELEELFERTTHEFLSQVSDHTAFGIRRYFLWKVKDLELLGVFAEEWLRGGLDDRMMRDVLTAFMSRPCYRDVYLVTPDGIVAMAAVKRDVEGRSFERSIGGRTAAGMTKSLAEGAGIVVTDMAGAPDDPSVKVLFMGYALGDERYEGALVVELRMKGIASMIGRFSAEVGKCRTWLLGLDFTRRVAFRNGKPACSETAEQAGRDDDCGPALRLSPAESELVRRGEGVFRPYGKDGFCFIRRLGIDGMTGCDFDWILVTALDSRVGGRGLACLERSFLYTGCMFLLVLFATMYFLSRHMVAPIERLYEGATAIAAGDLDRKMEVKGSDELSLLAMSFEQMRERLAGLVLRIQELVLSVNSSVNEIHAAMQEQSQACAELAAASSQTASSMSEAAATASEMSRSSALIREAVKDMGEASGGAVSKARDGRVLLERVVDKMESIRDIVRGTAARVQNMQGASVRISRIVGAISNIANKTNLLSLNAAIEAAKAGEYGEGFAVVAAEIKSLAEQTDEALGEIEEIVSSMQAAMNEVLGSMEHEVSEVEQGDKLIHEVRYAFENIVEASEKVSEGMEAIVTSVNEQAEAIKELSTAVADVTNAASDVAEAAARISSAARESIDTAERLRCQAVELGDRVKFFRVRSDD